MLNFNRVLCKVVRIKVTGCPVKRVGRDTWLGQKITGVERDRDTGFYLLLNNHQLPIAALNPQTVEYLTMV